MIRPKNKKYKYWIPSICYLLLPLWLFLMIPDIFAQTNLEFFFGSQKNKKVKIKKVLSTDTFKCENGEIVKLIGVKGLKIRRIKEKVERDKYGFIKKKEVSAEVPLEKQLLKDVISLLEGETIRLEFDTQAKDDEFNTLAYAFFENDNTFVNAKLLESGLCDLHIQLPNNKYKDILREAYQKGRAEQKGIHGQY